MISGSNRSLIFVISSFSCSLRFFSRVSDSWSRAAASISAEIALSRSRCSCVSSASLARITTSSGLVTSLLIAPSAFPARRALAVGAGLAPALLLGPIIADEIERARHDLVDQMGDLRRRIVERRHGRQDGRAP